MSGAISAVGSQYAATCAVLAVNNILTRHGHLPRHIDHFRAVAGGDYDADGNFEWLALARILNAEGFGFTPVLLGEYMQTPFTGGTLGFVLHTPGHWISLVPPAEAADSPNAAVLCDSRFTTPFALRAQVFEELFRAIADHQRAAGLAEGLPAADRLHLAARWSAFRVRPL